MSSNILGDRDTNAQTQSNPFTMEKHAEENKPKGMDYHRQVLENRLKENGDQNHTYISPSDSIMSPASQKLSSFKQKQINKPGAGKPRTLFAKAMTAREKDFGDFKRAPTSAADAEVEEK
ncbi:hypothetical protein LTR66_009566 [Elasticomyces elasticus]|nr:hypothetical protein LTR66_009566 [Elasticomyces elasticus]KAK5008454.1 hypothetical protein LTR28_003948 [Elasticomyces elasticus]